MAKSKDNIYALRRPAARRAAAPSAIDLFCGAGGITLGLINAGFDVRLCSDIDAACARTHQRNFPHIPFLHADIATLPSQKIAKAAGVRRGELDLLIGGPPCQGFSILGQRQLNDPRNQLFMEFLRVAADLRPKAVIIENVPGLATLEKGAVLRDIAIAFDEAGYTIDAAELVAAQYGVPQLRWRMMFVGWRKDLGRRGGFPEPTHGVAGIGDLVPNRTIPAALTKGFVTIQEAIGDLGAIAAGETGHTYARRPKGAFQQAMREAAPDELHNHYAPRLSEQNLERIRALKPGEDWRALPHHLLPPGMRRAHRKDHTRRYRRMKWDGIARAIITRFRDPKSGEYTHPEQDRTISIREAARIQSFPDWFVFEGSHTEQYEQVGNAVPVLMARAIGREIAKMLTETAEYRVPVKSRYRVPDAHLNRLKLVAAE